MNEEFKISIDITINTKTELTKEQIGDTVVATLDRVIKRANSPVRAYMSRFENGHLLLDTSNIEVTQVLSEAEIYKTKP